MTDIDHAAILRQHADTRRRGHSVNPEVLRAAADEIERLRKELADAYSKSVQVIADLSANLCTASALERERLTAERDEARRRVCDDAIRNGRVYRRVGSDTVRCQTPQEVAEMMGWDCFKENTDD